MPYARHDQQLRSMSDRYAHYKKLGLCPACGSRRPEEGKVKCRVCLDRNLAWWRLNKTRISKAQSENRRKLKEEVFEIYGKACACCGESRIEFLTIDHVKGDGAAHRRSLGNVRTIYLWLKKHGFPKKGFRPLCMNCNFSRGVYGYCPHELENHHDQVRSRARPRESARAG